MSITILKEATPDPAREKIGKLEEQHLDDLMVIAELYERTLVLEEQNLMALDAVAEVYEMILGGAL